MNKQKNKNKKSCMIIDITCPGDTGTEEKKKRVYILLFEVGQMLNVRDGVGECDPNIY